jgi:hypothetical protein
MRLPKLLVFLVFLAASVGSHAQQRKSPLSAKFRTNKFSLSQKRIACPVFEESQYPYQGLGFKLGDPFALTYKFYPSKHWAFAADVGRAASGLYNKYYRSLYDTYVQTDTLTADESIQYLAHKATVDWFLEAKFLYQWNADVISKGLQCYIGAGWQWRNTTLRYDYNVDSFTDPKFGKFTETRLTYGPTGILGFEYSYFSLPLSAFIEIEYFTDVLLDPGYGRFQGGVGLRYVF